MSRLEYRIPRRPAWLYPEGTILRTRYGYFKVVYNNYTTSGFRKWEKAYDD